MIEFIQIAQAATDTLAQTSEMAGEVASEGGALGSFGISWQLFLAQLINFGIIIFVMWKWVLTPVAKRLQERTNNIEKSLQDARSTEEDKVNFDAWKKEEMVKARQEAASVIKQAQDESLRVRDELIGKAKADQQAVVNEAKSEIAAEKEKVMKAIKSESAELIMVSLEKILRKKMNAKEDEEYIEEILNS
jgi:F-type H+-transporting ATPase subunit b